MPDGAVTELVKPEMSGRPTSVEPPTSAPETDSLPESFTPIATQKMENSADMEEARLMVQNMIAQADSKPQEPTLKHEPQVKNKRNIGEFLAKHKMLGLLMSPILLIFASILGAFKKDRSGGQGH